MPAGAYAGADLVDGLDHLLQALRSRLFAARNLFRLATAHHGQRGPRAIPLFRIAVFFREFEESVRRRQTRQPIEILTRHFPLGHLVRRPVPLVASNGISRRSIPPQYEQRPGRTAKAIPLHTDFSDRSYSFVRRSGRPLRDQQGREDQYGDKYKERQQTEGFVMEVDTSLHHVPLTTSY